jgi:hypothetical protein
MFFSVFVVPPTYYKPTSSPLPTNNHELLWCQEGLQFSPSALVVESQRTVQLLCKNPKLVVKAHIDLLLTAHGQRIGKTKQDSVKNLITCTAANNNVKSQSNSLEEEEQQQAQEEGQQQHHEEEEDKDDEPKPMKGDAHEKDEKESEGAAVVEEHPRVEQEAVLFVDILAMRIAFF